MVNQWFAPVVLGSALVAGCDMGSGMMMGGDAWPSSYESNGERIYFTGTSESGNAITSIGAGMHQRMMGGACASCHGADRSGGRLMPQFWKKAPPLTRDALFEAHQEGSAHGDHETYTGDTLQRAVFRGVDPSGNRLDEAMPRWSMSESDWRDLLEYLRS